MIIIINSHAFPYVHVHSERGYLVNALVNPKVSTATATERVSDRFKHRLIPLKLNEDEDGSMSITTIDLGWTLTSEGHIIENDNPITSSDFMNRLADWKYVAICTTDGKLLSNRRKTNIPFFVGETSLTEYRQEIGEFEVFQMEHDPITGYFSFKSHSNMYLQPNLTFNTTPCRPSKFHWKISPLLEDYEERIEFVGVSRLGASIEAAEFVMKKTAVDGLIGEAYISPFVKVMYNELQSGQSHCFHGVSNDLWHYFLRGYQDELYMVVTTDKFSSAYASAFMGDLPPLYDRYVADGEERNATIERLQKNGKDAEVMMNKELDNLTLYYDVENEKFVPEELRKLKIEMEQNIAKMGENVGDAESILETSKNLVEQAEVFKKTAANLKKEKALPKGVILGASIVAGAVLGATIVIATGGAAAPAVGVAAAAAAGEAGVAAAGVGAAVAAAEVGTAAAGIGAAATATTAVGVEAGVTAAAGVGATVAAAEVGTAAAGAAATTAVGVEAGAATAASPTMQHYPSKEVAASAENVNCDPKLGECPLCRIFMPAYLLEDHGCEGSEVVHKTPTRKQPPELLQHDLKPPALKQPPERLVQLELTPHTPPPDVQSTTNPYLPPGHPAKHARISYGPGVLVGATVAGAEGAGCVGTAAGIGAAAGAGVGLVGEGIRHVGPRMWKDYVPFVQHD